MFGGGPVTSGVPLVSATIGSGDKNTSTSATWYWSIETPTVEWRQRFASSGRVASRGLHYHASTQNWPMIAGGRSDSYNDRVRIRDSDIECREVRSNDCWTQKQAEQWHAHNGLDRPGVVVADNSYSPWVLPGRSVENVKDGLTDAWLGSHIDIGFLRFRRWLLSNARRCKGQIQQRPAIGDCCI